MRIKTVPQKVFDKITCDGAYAPNPVKCTWRVDDQDKFNKDGKLVRKATGRIHVAVHFDDGTTVHVAQCENDPNDIEKAVLFAIAKRVYGRVEVKDAAARKIEIAGAGYAAMIKDVVERATGQNQVKPAKPAAPAASAEILRMRKTVPVTTEQIWPKPDAKPIQVKPPVRDCPCCRKEKTDDARRQPKNKYGYKPAGCEHKRFRDMTLTEKREYWRNQKRGH